MATVDDYLDSILQMTAQIREKYHAANKVIRPDLLKLVMQVEDMLDDVLEQFDEEQY